MMYLIFLISILMFIFGYFIYARYISKVIKINNANPVPSVEKNDGVDYVPICLLFLVMLMANLLI
ncbi:MAG: carbon starvation CstA family protein [Brevinematia bacterium]